jgi:hypothetical protein
MGPEKLPPGEFLAAIRGHWGIENGLNHVLDRSWEEDKQRCANPNAGMARKTLRHMALNVLRTADTPAKARSMRQKAQCLLGLFLDPDAEDPRARRTP